MSDVIEHPIIFSGPMIRAYMAGRKTQTRRIMKDQPLPHRTEVHDIPQLGVCFSGPWFYEDGTEMSYEEAVVRHGGWPDVEIGFRKCPYGEPRHRLWFREAWRTSVCVDSKRGGLLETPGHGYGWPVWYEADGGEITWRGSQSGGPGFVSKGRYRHARFMPRWASRFTPEVTDVRVQRLQDISEEDSEAEGIFFIDGHGWTFEGCFFTFADARSAYRELWGSIHGPASWDENKWVWAVSFPAYTAGA